MTDNDHSEKTAVILTTRTDLQKTPRTEACLIIVRGSQPGHHFFITMDEMVIGRDPAADISITDQGISRRHVKVSRRDGKILLTDLGSSNGTKINDKTVPANETQVLQKEDMIKLGTTIFKFLPAGAVEILAWENLGSAAHTDPMTKIFNKGYLTDALEAEFKRAKALHSDFCVLFFDLDHFKKVNDTYGHDAGDYVLKEFTGLVRTNFLRPKDVFARYGGEEFVLLLLNTNAEVASQLAEKIRAAVERHPFNYEGKRIPVTTSMGIAELRTDIESAQGLLKAADKALYTAKQTGRNRIVVA